MKPATVAAAAPTTMIPNRMSGTASHLLMWRFPFFPLRKRERQRWRLNRLATLVPLSNGLTLLQDDEM